VQAPGLIKRSLIVAATLAVAACSQNPQFRIASANRAYDALEGLYVLLAKAELGALRSPASYAGSVDDYAAVIAGFQTGRLLDAGRPDAAAAAESLSAGIARCVDDVKRMSAVHKAGGVAPGSAEIPRVRASCDAAARSVAASETSSWLFATAAGDV